MHTFFGFLSVAGLLALTVAQPSHAASFDCNKAVTADEKSICADRSLNDKDVRMELLYSIDRRFMGMGARGALIDEQADWLRRRHTCGAETDCLNTLHDQRINALRKFIDERVVIHGPF